MASTNITTFPGKVGISNANPTHTLSIGSTVFVDDTGLVVNGAISTTSELIGDGAGLSNIQTSNVIGLTDNVARIGTLETDLSDNSSRIGVVSSDLSDNSSRIGVVSSDLSDNSSRISSIESGAHTFTGIKTFQNDVILESNLRVKGDLLVANTINMTVSDPILELGSNNLNTGDVGLVMTRHGTSNSNIAIFFDESVDVLKLGYTLDGAGDTTLEFDSNALAVNIQGALTAASVSGDGSGLSGIQSSNVSDFASNVTRITNLETDLGSNVTRITNLETDLGSNVTRIVALESGDLTIGGEKTFSSNLKVGTANLFVDTVTGNVGIGTTSPDAPLEVHGPDLTGEAVGTTSLISRHVSGLDGVLNIFGVAASNGEETLGLQTQIDKRSWAADIAAGWVTGSASRYILALQPYKGNVGIGTTNPDLELHVHDANNANSGIVLSSTTGYHRLYEASGQLYFQSGAAASADSRADINFTSMYASTTYMKILGSNGNVGIGLSSPAFTLDVNGVSRSRGVVVNSGFSNNTARPALSSGSTHPSYEIRSLGGNGNVGSTGADDGFLRLRAGGGTGTNSASYIDLSGYSVYSGSDMRRNIVFGTLGTERMRIKENGNVGIGTTNPGYKLHVAGDINFTGTLYQNGTAFSGGGGSTVWSTSGSNIYYNSGNVGIGTTSPNELLELYDSSSTASGMRIHDSTSNAPKIDFLRGGTSRVGSQTEFGLSDYSDWRIQANGPSLYIYNQYTGANSGSLKNVMTMLHNSGNVGIGTTSPSVKLDVNGYIAHNNPVFYAHNFGNGGGATSPNNYIVYRNTEVNVGGNFSTSTGIFTCPRNGVYKFTWGAIGGNADTVYRYYIRINNANIINGTHNRMDNTASGSNYGNGTSSIILSLSTNDTVRIYYVADNGSTASYGFNYDIFMGYMISA